MIMDEVVSVTETAMDQILSCFKKDCKITVLVRSPGKPNSDFCLTNDELPEVAEMVQRRMEATGSATPAEDAETWTDDELWQIVNEFDDRNSPEEYPEMVMLNEAEFRDFLDRGRASLKAANVALNAQLAKTESHVEAVKNTLGVRCTEVANLEERFRMLENELSAPAGYRVIPRQPTDTMRAVMAFNLCAQFGGKFTIANEAFAMAVYKQAWELGIRSQSEPSPRAQALEEGAILEALEECETYFDNLSDADHDGTGFVANKEMRLLISVRAAIRALSSQPVGDRPEHTVSRALRSVAVIPASPEVSG